MATATCPLCGAQTMVRHCDDPKALCTMLRCTDIKCGTVLDPRRGIGHSMYGVARVKGVIQPFRLLFNRTVRMWQRRPDGGVAGTGGYR